VTRSRWPAAGRPPLAGARQTRAGYAWHLAALVVFVISTEMVVANNDKELTGFEPGEPIEWRPINDGVMGGLSRSLLKITPAGTGLFEGEVSLANNGGFASVRARLGPVDLSGYQSLAARVRGDGKRYRLRLHTGAGVDGIAYQADFDTEAGEWQEIVLPFSSFEPTFRGRRLTDVEPLDTGNVQQIGLMIADKQAGAFRLELDWIRASGMAAGDVINRS